MQEPSYWKSLWRNEKKVISKRETEKGWQRSRSKCSLLQKEHPECSTGADAINRIQLFFLQIWSFFCWDRAPCSTKYSKTVERTVRERALLLKKADVLWNRDNERYQSPFFVLIQLYSDKTTTFLKCRALVAYPDDVMWLNLSPKQRTCLIDYGETSLDFLQLRVVR